MGCYTYLPCGFPEPQYLVSIASISTLGFLVEQGKNHGKSWSNELQKRFIETFCNHWQRIKIRSEGLFYVMKFSLCLFVKQS
jgi:hypothetical protein